MDCLVKCLGGKKCTERQGYRRKSAQKDVLKVIHWRLDRLKMNAACFNFNFTVKINM